LSDAIQHECGLALLRLRQPLSYYRQRYGTPLWGLDHMYVLMEKQHNRGQDGAGLAALRLGREPGQPYIARERAIEPAPPWQALITKVEAELERSLSRHSALMDAPEQLKDHFPYAGEAFLGHLRYATHGAHSERACHPVIRSNNWQSRTLLMAGNFNLTNNAELFERLIELGQHPHDANDTVTVLERVGHFLDETVEALVQRLKQEGLSKRAISDAVARELDLQAVLQQAAKAWDGGYLMGGMLGQGDLFALRDPNGIRPGFYYYDEEIAVAASERQAIATSFDIPFEQIQELPRGHAFIVHNDGTPLVKSILPQQPAQSCSFERIYFSRGNDAEIYAERKQLGAEVTPHILAAIDHDLDNTVFSYIPNTAVVAFWGMLKSLEDALNERKLRMLQEAAPQDPDRLRELLNWRVRVENVVLKDTKLRTFITNDQARDHMAAHVYDITYGSLVPDQDTLVCIDDSIVRGTTLRQSILRILQRLRPRRIVIVSSAPQIRYPDCYGIDMSQIGRFIAFQAAVALLKDRDQQGLLDETYQRCKAAEAQGCMTSENLVKAVYEPFSAAEISAKIAELLGADLDCELKLVYQSIEGLQNAVPHHSGMWYFTGDYPTPGGNRVVNQAFINYYEGKQGARAY
jgi:amidophosphoribosyltransferase